MSWFVAAAVLLFVGYLAAHAVPTNNRRQALRAKVFDNLDNALANGYFKPGSFCCGMSAEELAQDLLAYAADFEDVYAAYTIVPYVTEWKQKRQQL